MASREHSAQKPDQQGNNDKRQRYEDVHFVDSTGPVWNYSLFDETDIANYQAGTHYRLYDLFGNHAIEVLGKKGYYFSVWAPNATYVSVIGNFNNWDYNAHPLFVRLDNSGIWEGFIPGIGKGESYKYHIIGFEGKELDKGDPYAKFWEKRPATASITWDTDFFWQDGDWMQKRAAHNALNAPWSVYEVHLASWMRPNKYDEESYNSYEDLKTRLVPYVKDMGFTHVELMPVMEHPFDGSWGYQGTGYYAPTSRFGDPQMFMSLIEAFHHEGIGVILDWVPSHFPYDSHGLYMFDGTHTYEYADMRKGFHPDWNSYIFNYRRGEVRSFLGSNARYWFDRYHIDGIRVDAVSSMLKLNYSRTTGQWEPNEYGGDGNIEAINLIRDINEMIFRDFPDVQTIAEEATDWPKVSKPTFEGGLGFGMKWMMGWMHDTLDYFKMDPYFRQYHQNKFTFSMMYYYDENFMLPLSHDEVVHGKSPMIYKMPGDEWQNKSELQWELLQYNYHQKLQSCVRDLNGLLRSEPALYENQFSVEGFEWVDLNHRAESVICFKRKGRDPEDDIIVILNLTPVVKNDWKIYSFGKSHWQELFNSDEVRYGGTGDTYNPEIKTTLVNKNDNEYEINLHLPPLAAVVIG